ncbi:hypothetical protein GQ42DRAFT_165560 [Ramicandelaber brevisporus]|nr:hypothetical protein GQ42DRAFT_165560 [Ramicandelaber brevisporus]
MEFMSDILGSGNPQRPSLFELIAQARMSELISPALQYVVSVYAQRYPRLLVPLANRHEQFHAVVMLLVEYHYLRQYGSSFAEHFYGLKRVRSTPHPDTGSVALARGDIWRSVTGLVVLPYLKTCGDSLYERLSGGAAARLFGSSAAPTSSPSLSSNVSADRWNRLMERLKAIFVRIYPYLHMIYHGSSLAYSILYMFDRTRYPSPFLHLIGTEIHRMTMHDYRSLVDRDRLERELVRSMWSRMSLLQMVKYVLARGITSVLDALKIVLPLSIFLYRFIEWWYSSRFANASADGGSGSGGGGGGIGNEQGAPIPLPPARTPAHPKGVPLPESVKHCPLCERDKVNPAMLPSGYAFCYPCIFRYVEREGCCPVSLQLFNVNDIRKLYDNI